MTALGLKAPADGFTSRFPDTRFDAILVVSFGGPEGMDDVIPFLENVTRGRNIPRERLEEVAHHYELFGGVSPINAQNRALIDALRTELDAHGIGLPIYFGNRNWHPLLADTLREMAEEGVERALAFFTSAYSSYSGCRQYRENLYNAQQVVGPAAPEVLKTRMFFNHPGWVFLRTFEPGKTATNLRRFGIDAAIIVGPIVVSTAHRGAQIDVFERNAIGEIAVVPVGSST